MNSGTTSIIHVYAVSGYPAVSITILMIDCFTYRHSDHHVQGGQLELHDRYEAAPPLLHKDTASTMHRDDDDKPSVVAKKSVEADVLPVSSYNDYECFGFDNPTFVAAQPTDIDEAEETATEVEGDEQKVDLANDST